MHYDDSSLNDNLSYDSKLIEERLALAFDNPYPPPKPAATLEAKMHQTLLEQALIREQVKKELEATIFKPPPVQETFRIENKEGCATCQKKKKEGFEGGVELFDDFTISKQFLIVLVFIMFLICVIQYFNNLRTFEDMAVMIRAMGQYQDLSNSRFNPARFANISQNAYTSAFAQATGNPDPTKTTSPSDALPAPPQSS